jgi:hypothetical protein
MYFVVLLTNFISIGVILVLSCSPTDQVLHPYKKVGNARVLYIFTLAFPTLLYRCETWAIPHYKVGKAIVFILLFNKKK